jgi:phosphate uptake regulator
MEYETRKVQKLGYSSVGISLPKEWALSNGLKPGAVVGIVTEEDGTLRIRAGPPEDLTVHSEATIDADEWTTPEALTRVITGSYIVGRNTIRVRSREELTPEHLKEVHEAVRGLTGLTIVNQGPKFVTIENFAEPTRFPIDGLLRRLHYLTSRMERLALGALTGRADGNVEEVPRMEAEVDRLYWLVVRQLLLASKNRSIAGMIGEVEPRHLLGDRVVAITLENIGDLWEEVAAGAIPLVKGSRRIPKGFGSALGPRSDRLERVIDLTMTAFFTSDLTKANEALDEVAAFEAELRELASSVPLLRCDRKGEFCTTCTLLRSVLRPVEHVAKLYGTIAQLTMNRSLEDVKVRGPTPAPRAG